MTVITRECLRCGREVRLTETSSLWKADGTEWGVICGVCWQKEGGDED